MYEIKIDSGQPIWDGEKRGDGVGVVVSMGLSEVGGRKRIFEAGGVNRSYNQAIKGADA